MQGLSRHCSARSRPPYGKLGGYHKQSTLNTGPKLTGYASVKSPRFDSALNRPFSKPNLVYYRPKPNNVALIKSSSTNLGSCSTAALPQMDKVHSAGGGYGASSRYSPVVFGASCHLTSLSPSSGSPIRSPSIELMKEPPPCVYTMFQRRRSTAADFKKKVGLWLSVFLVAALMISADWDIGCK